MSGDGCGMCVRHTHGEWGEERGEGEREKCKSLIKERAEKWVQMMLESDDHLKLDANMRRDTLEFNITCYIEVPSLSSSSGNLDTGPCPLIRGQTRNRVASNIQQSPLTAW